jgi:hypothetical protein
MAERIVSPGVFTRENDLSYLAQGVGEIGAAFIGPFKQGPAFVPTIVYTATEFENIFGTPDGTYYTDYAAKNYLSEAGTATIVRVAGIGGYTQTVPLGIYVTPLGSTKKLIGVIAQNVRADGTGFPSVVATSGSVAGELLLSGSNMTAVSASVLPSATNDLADVFGTSPFGTKKGYTYLYFENAAVRYATGNYTASAEALPSQAYTGTTAVPAYNAAYTPYVKSQLISGLRYSLFRFATLGHGDTYNTQFKVGISNVKAAGEDGSTIYSTFTVTIRAFSDTDKRKSVVETYSNVNLDPASPNYIARIIGDRWNTIDQSGKITENGDYSNKSAYVRVEVSLPGTFPPSAAPFGHGAYTNPVDTTTDVDVPVVTYSTASATNSTTTALYYSGFDFETLTCKTDNLQYLKPYPAAATVGANVDFGFDSQLTYQMTGSSNADMVKRQFVLAFQGGYDGMDPRVSINLGTDIAAANTQGHNCTNSTSSGSLAYAKAIAAISNTDEWDINLVVTPGIVRELHPAITTAVIDMVEARQDCFYIADFSQATATITTVVEQANAVDTNYVGTYYPWLKTVDTNTNKLISVPPSVLMPAVFASNDAIAAEWWAPAGLNRGGVVGAVSVLNRLTHAERDTLYENKVNPIAAFPGEGICAFGQKTLQDKPSALDRINVRRLLIKLKKFVSSTSRYLVFEQNNSETRAKFINTVTPYMESVQQRQGLYSFHISMGEAENTPDVIDRNILAGSIYLQPTKSAEMIVIDFNILPTGGASFSA